MWAETDVSALVNEKEEIEAKLRCEIRRAVYQWP
jgi:hypothetical protein